MSDYIDTREGWTEVRDGEEIGDREYVAFHGAGDHVQRYWIREAPVLPLPTTPYTVIRVTWRDPGEEPESILTRAHTAAWFGLDGAMFAGEISDLIVSFEVLSEPRAVTAKAVLDHVVEIGIPNDGRGGIRKAIRDGVTEIAREFGVES